MKKDYIYLDHAATTPTDKEVLETMLPYFNKHYGNPSSLHKPGQKATHALEKARIKVAEFLNCSSEEVIFTGSATEANNTVLKGAAKKTDNPHIVTTEFEHSSVRKTCKYLEEKGVEVSYVSPEENGIVDPKKIKEAIKDNTVLVSVMYVNNEIGTIQPIEKISKILEGKGIIFHTDAVQATNYLNCDVKKLGIDTLTFSGHKIYAPKGIGVLFKKQGVSFDPLLHGGGQENGRRASTENIPGIVAIGKAVEKIQKRDTKKEKQLRDFLIEKITQNIEGTELNGSKEKRIPNNANISFSKVEGESIIFSLNEKNIFASTGSACSSEKLEPSHVLTAIGKPAEKAHGSIRFSLGKDTTKQQIQKVVEVMPKIIKRLRKISPL